jgi:hypothetical protein
LGDQIKKNEGEGTFGKYGGRRGAYRVLARRAVGKRALVIPDGSVILKWISEKWDGETLNDCPGSG